MPRSSGEPAEVTEARERGYASTFGEVEPGAYGVAIPLKGVVGAPAACINLITTRGEVAERAAPVLLAMRAQIDTALA